MQRKTLREIIKILKPLMEAPGERRAIINAALGGYPIKDVIEMEGSATVFTTNLVHLLESRGLNAELTALLNEAAQYTGTDNQQKLKDAAAELNGAAESHKAPDEQPGAFLYGTGDIATLTGLSAQKVRRLLKAGVIPVALAHQQEKGARWHYHGDAVAWVALAEPIRALKATYAQVGAFYARAIACADGDTAAALANVKAHVQATDARTFPDFIGAFTAQHKCN